MITLATLPPFAAGAKGTMVGTVKIISYAVAAWRWMRPRRGRGGR
jgi:uncharacterized membrane protein